MLVKTKKKELKKVMKLVPELLNPAQGRGDDMQGLFQHETRPEPPSLPKEDVIC